MNRRESSLNQGGAALQTTALRRHPYRRPLRRRGTRGRHAANPSL